MPIVWVQRILYRWEFQMIQYISGFRGGGEADAPPPWGIPPPADPKGPPLYYFRISIFGWLTLKFSLKAPLAPIYTNFEGGARAEKTQFFGRIFP